MGADRLIVVARRPLSQRPLGQLREEGGAPRVPLGHSDLGGVAARKVKGEVAADDELVERMRRVAGRGAAPTLSAQERRPSLPLPLRALVALQMVGESRPPVWQRDGSRRTQRCLTPTCVLSALTPHSQRTGRGYQTGCRKRCGM